MGYYDNNPNGLLYIGAVNWSNDYSNVMLFDNKEARNNFMRSHLYLIKTNLTYFSPNGYVDVNSNIDGMENHNYIYYIPDSDINDTAFCCFITSYEFIAPATTRLYVRLDVFQQYIYNTTFFQSFIERAIVSKASDTPGRYVLNEPFNVSLQYQHLLNNVDSESNWNPIWALHSASYYNSADGQYHYEGLGGQNTYGEYTRFIESQEEIKTLLRMYGRASLGDALQKISENIDDAVGEWTEAGKAFIKDIITGMLSGGISTITGYNQMLGMSSLTEGLSLAQYQDHRDELIGLYAIPTWLKNKFVDDGGDVNYADNRRVNKEYSLSINSSTLANNNYTPRNKKLLTSVCRMYVLANRNGIKIGFKPELFTGNPSLILTGIPTSTSGYQYEVTNYADYQTRYGEVTYSSERRVGYDANTGINKALNILSAGGSAAASIGTIASGAASGNPITALSGVGGLLNTGVNAIDALGAKEEHFGNNGDLLRITGGSAQLKWYEVNPSLEEIQAIDNFFDMYGYNISKHANPANFLRVRSKWNYIKTADINLKVPAPADYENEMKRIFNSGVTLWRDYSTFGDYSQTNS